jgi:hypothetical protein
MTVTINLPQHVEQAYASAARTKGMSVDALLTDILLLNVPVADSEEPHFWTEELGIPVLRTGQAISVADVNKTIEAIRLERDLAHLGKF